MRKKITVVIVLLIFSNSSIRAQENNKEDEKCVKTGKFILDAYYGYPYLFGSYIKEIANNYDNVQVTNLNHLGGKFEYMLNNTIGLGIDYTYASSVAKYSETNAVYQNGVSTNVTNDYIAKIIKQRMLAKINIHFATSKYLDPYATGGIGYKNSLVSSNNPNDQVSVDDLNNSFLNILPVAFRLGIGLRYYFIENLGVCVEAGIGGPLVQAGLSGKF